MFLMASTTGFSALSAPCDCHALSPLATDKWCCDNCAAGNCPKDLCACTPPAPPSPPSPPSPPLPPPGPEGPYGQLILAYFSGPALDTAAKGAAGINALSLAFFSPAAMLSPCSFNATSASACLKPASGAGGQLGMPWVLATIEAVAAGLAANAAHGAKPVVFISFGGLTEVCLQPCASLSM